MLLAPETWGDIVPINVDGNAVWSFSKHAFLGATIGVVRTVKSQGLGKGLCKDTLAYDRCILQAYAFLGQSLAKASSFRRCRAEGSSSCRAWAPSCDGTWHRANNGSVRYDAYMVSSNVSVC